MAPPRAMDNSKTPEMLVVESPNLRYSFYSNSYSSPGLAVRAPTNHNEYRRHLDSKHCVSELRKELYVSREKQVGPYPGAAAEWQRGVGSVITKVDDLMKEMAAMDSHVKEAYRNSMR